MKKLITLLGILALAGCGGDGGGGSSAPPAPSWGGGYGAEITPDGNVSNPPNVLFSLALESQAGDAIFGAYGVRSESGVITWQGAFAGSGNIVNGKFSGVADYATSSNNGAYTGAANISDLTISNNTIEAGEMILHLPGGTSATFDVDGLGVKPESGNTSYLPRLAGKTFRLVDGFTGDVSIHKFNLTEGIGGGVTLPGCAIHVALQEVKDKHYYVANVSTGSGCARQPSTSTGIAIIYEEGGKDRLLILTANTAQQYGSVIYGTAQ